MSILSLSFYRIKKIKKIYIESYRINSHSVSSDKIMREKSIEQKLVKMTKLMGGIALKLVSPGFDGMPDRLVLMPKGKCGFVEVKAPGKKLRPLQEARHRLLRDLGFKVYTLDGMEQIERILKEIGGEAE